jgi:sortase family protein
VQLPEFFENMRERFLDLVDQLKSLPALVYFVAIPIPIFVITVAVMLAMSGGGGDPPEAALGPSNTPSLANVDLPATATPTPAPTTTPEPTVEPPNREDCAQIQGTEYESPEERDWYLANCLGGPQTATNSGGGGAVSAGEYYIGGRLIIPAAGVDATVTGMDVGANGAMPDPVGYFNAVLYNFPFQAGLGGSNRVLAGHVDCAYCHGGSSGTAIFWSVRNISIGASAQYVTADGTVENYVVINSYAVSGAADFSSIVASGTADMTIITCTGTFSGGHYDNRHVVAFQRTS